MLTESPYVAKRVQKGIPIWDILVRGVYVGILTNLPMEDSPMATVRYYGYEETFAGSSIYAVLEQVGDWLSRIEHDARVEAEFEYYNEVIAPMEYAERQAEMAFMRHYGNEPMEAF